MVGRYKQWLGMMTKAYPQAKELWDQVKRIKALDEIVQQLEQNQFFSYLITKQKRAIV